MRVCAPSSVGLSSFQTRKSFLQINVSLHNKYNSGKEIYTMTKVYECGLLTERKYTVVGLKEAAVGAGSNNTECTFLRQKHKELMCAGNASLSIMYVMTRS